MKKFNDYIEIIELIKTAQINLIYGSISSIEELFPYSDELKKWYNKIDDQFLLHVDVSSLEHEFNVICEQIKQDYKPTKYDFIEETINIVDESYNKIENVEVGSDVQQHIMLKSDMRNVNKTLNEIKDLWIE